MAITTPLASNANKTTSYINNAFAKNSGNTLSNQLGVNAKAPAPATSGNTTIKPNMSVAPNMSPAFIGPMDTYSEATKVKNMQTQLNAKNAGQPGWTPLQVDGILGPKTKAAQSFKPTTQNSGGGSSSSSMDYSGGGSYQQPQYQQQYQTPPQQYTPTQQQGDQPDISNTSFLQNLAKKQNESSSEYKDALEKANGFNDALLKSRTNQAHGLAENAMNPIPLQFQQGRAQVLQNQYGQEQAALGAAYSAATNQQGQANTQQGLQQSATTAGVSATMPQMQFGQLTNPQTGSPVNGGMYGSNPQLQAAVQQAVQIAQTSGPNDPNVQSLLSTFGVPGQILFNQYMQAQNNGNYNPAAMNAVAQTNVGIGSNYQQKSAALSVPIEQMKTASEQLVDFMDRANINANDSKWKNKTFNQFMLETQSPQDKVTLQMALASLKNYTSQVISAETGLNIDAVTSDVNSYDFGSLPPAQVQQALNNFIKEGETRKKALDAASKGGYGTTGILPYLGSQNYGNSQYSVGPQNNKNLAGNAFMNNVLNIPGMVQGMFNKLFN